MAVRTYAPVGQTPILRVKLSRDHISAIGALTAGGRLFMQTQDHSYKGEDVVCFLKQLLRQIPGKLLIIWDGSAIHHCQAIKDFLAAGAAARIHLERLPAYAPEFNPQEGGWNLLKRRELKNCVARLSLSLRTPCCWPVLGSGIASRRCVIVSFMLATHFRFLR